MTDKFKECNDGELAVSIAAADAVAKLIDVMLNSNAKEYPDFIRDLRAAYRIGAMGLRVTLDFQNDTLTALVLYSLGESGASKTISTVTFKTMPHAGQTLQ